MNNLVKLLFLGISGKIRLVIGICFFITLLVLGIFIYSNIENNLTVLYEAKLTNMSRLIYQMTKLYVQSSVKNYLTGIAGKTRDLAAYYHNKVSRGEITEVEAKALFKSVILDPQFGKIGDTGYIATLDTKGMATMHPKPGVEGSSLGYLPVMQKAIAMKNGFMYYLWKNPEDETLEEKAAAITYFEAWDMIIWVTAYKIDASLLIDMEALSKNITQLKIGKAGYPFIINTKGKVLIHPNYGMQNKIIYENTDSTQRHYIAQICEDVLKKAADPEKDIPQKAVTAVTGQSGARIQGAVIPESDEEIINPSTLFYAGEEPGDKNPRNKMAAYVYFKDMDWIIFSSASVSELYENIDTIKQASIWIVIVAFVLSNAVIAFFIFLVLKPLADIKKIVPLIARGDISRRIEVASSDEMGEIAEQFNTLVDAFRKVLNRIRKSSAILLDSVHGLSVSSQEISSTSNEQAAAVKEIVSTMEDSDTLARSIAEKVKDVAETAGKMKDTVAGGFSIIKGSLGKMDEIKKTNTETITGIQALSDKIGSIWEIVNIINSIADQTRIIAFNAELEASAAGEAGKNFQIVATEIRRLADSTVSATREIKIRIHEIQHSSDNLIISSEEGTFRIKEGWNLSRELQTVFDDILDSSGKSAESAGQIALSINQQVAAFEQILLTLKQISEGIDNFVESTKTTTRESEKLKAMADSLDAVVNEYITEDKETDL